MLFQLYSLSYLFFFFFFNDTATTEIYTLSLHDALPIRVGTESRWLEVRPADSLRVSYTLDNSHPIIGLQAGTYGITEDVFAQELAPARTYGFLRDVPAMRQNGLARGGS